MSDEIQELITQVEKVSPIAGDLVILRHKPDAPIVSLQRASKLLFNMLESDEKWSGVHFVLLPEGMAIETLDEDQWKRVMDSVVP